MRTVLLGYIFSDALCAVVMALLWRHHGRWSRGPGYWLANSSLQCVTLVLVILRESLPPWASIMLAHGLLIVGIILLYIGLEKFIGARSSPLRHYVLLIGYLTVHGWFTWGHPSLEGRTLNMSLGLMIICWQCAWLMLNPSSAGRPRGVPLVGLVFVAYTLFSLLRIAAIVLGPQVHGTLILSPYDPLIMLTYQMLSIALTLGLFMLVIRRHSDDLEAQGKALQESSALVRGLFDNMDIGAMILEVRGDGATANDYRAKEVNVTVQVMEGKTRAELVGLSLSELRPDSRAPAPVAALRKTWQTGQALFLEAVHYQDDRHNFWYESHVFKLPTGEVVWIYRNVTERQQAEAALRENMEEIARMNKVMINREERILELKREVNQLLAAAGQAPKFGTE